VIDAEDFLVFCDEAFDELTAIVVGLGDDLANRRPPLEGANTAYAILTHCLGVATYWSSAVNQGGVVPRDRAAEFTASGPVGELAARTQAVREAFRATVLATDFSARPANPPSREDFFVHRRGAVLMHVYQELSQHLGQLELTRDVVNAQDREEHAV
jgi:uncharacterized damage-inducible protein DinB